MRILPKISVSGGMSRIRAAEQAFPAQSSRRKGMAVSGDRSNPAEWLGQKGNRLFE
ncbi:MAG: hypothetical protein IJW44_04625 [Clostridia bacterium]|nr:hypothetical protein [Clostridia bacterium]